MKPNITQDMIDDLAFENDVYNACMDEAEQKSQDELDEEAAREFIKINKKDIYIYMPNTFCEDTFLAGIAYGRSNPSKDVKELIECMEEAIDLMDDTRNGEYVPDNFTTQPWKTVLKRFKESK